MKQLNDKTQDKSDNFGQLLKTPVSCHKVIGLLIKELSALSENLRASIKTAPKGSIIVKTRKGIKRYYKCTDQSSAYLGKKDTAEIKALTQKKYEARLLKAVLKEKEALERAFGAIDKEQQALESVLKKIPEELYNYIQPNELTGDGYIRKWSKSSNWGAKYKAEIHTNYYTLKGEKVRSKSEIIIADRLFNAGLPYHYELAFSPNNGASLFYPDFTVLNTRTLETWYWEHFGMIDDQTYSSNAKSKLELYAEFGLVPGKNLIITFETSQNQLNTKYIDRLIELYLT